jgi:hypothetical protein
VCDNPLNPSGGDALRCPLDAFTLKIWVDANGDAITQDGELHTLGDLSIKSIDLAAVTDSR